MTNHLALKMAYMVCVVCSLFLISSGLTSAFVVNWPLDEGVNNQISGYSDMNPTTYYNYTLQGGAAGWKSGSLCVDGACYDFDSERAQLNDAYYIHPSNLTAWSICFWMNKTTEHGDVIGNEFSAAIIGNNGHNVYCEQGPGGVRNQSDVVVDDGVFHHICCTYGSDTVKIYIDNVLAGVSTGTPVYTIGDTGDLCIGGRCTGGGTEPKTLDAMVFADWELSAGEVEDIFLGGDGMDTTTTTTTTTTTSSSELSSSSSSFGSSSTSSIASSSTSSIGSSSTSSVESSSTSSIESSSSTSSSSSSTSSSSSYLSSSSSSTMPGCVGELTNELCMVIGTNETECEKYTMVFANTYFDCDWVNLEGWVCWPNEVCEPSPEMVTTSSSSSSSSSLESSTSSSSSSTSSSSSFLTSPSGQTSSEESSSSSSSYLTSPSGQTSSSSSSSSSSSIPTTTNYAQPIVNFVSGLPEVGYALTNTLVQFMMVSAVFIILGGVLMIVNAVKKKFGG